MDKEINNNGYKYVDLELPSGTLWAEKNVGADKPFEYGLYFQWGDTKGYAKDYIQKSRKTKNFSWNDYKFSINGSNISFSKYTTEGDKLELEDDAAHVNMGGDWHIPTPDQIQELLSNTTNEWTTQDGVNGRLFTSKKDDSKSIFIPASGFASGGSLIYSGAAAIVWSSVLDSVNANFGQYLYFHSDYASLFSGSRYYGLSVRGVIDNKCNCSKDKKNGDNSKGKKNESNEKSTFAEMLENELKKNLKLKITSDYGGYVEVNLLYKGEVIDSDVCQVTTDFNPLDE